MQFRPELNFTVDTNETRPMIFYGAGKYAAANIKRYQDMGLAPVCFADKDKTKHGKLFCGYKVMSLDEALSAFIDYLLVITVDNEFLAEVTEYLISRGVPAGKLKYPDPVEWRRGCIFGGHFISFKGNTCGSCCMPYHRRFIYDGLSIDSIFAEYDNYCKKLIDDLRCGNVTFCDECWWLVHNYWLANPKPRFVHIATSFSGDACNFRCLDCSAKDLLDNGALAKDFINISPVDMLDKVRQISGGGGECTFFLPMGNQHFHNISNL
jgi:hypothetical protein